MNNCKDCTQLLRFETTGIKEVPCDGFCLKAGKDKPESYIPVMLDSSCINYQSKHRPLGPLRIASASPSSQKTISMPDWVTPTEKRVVANTPPNMLTKPVKKPSGNCVDCVNWRRKGFSTDGECWSAESDQKGRIVGEQGTCPCFHAHANNNAHPGDIIEVQVGEQWQLIFVGTDYIVVRDRMGVEKVFDKKGLRFKKCQS